MAFIEASYSPLLESNYMAFSALSSITWTKLSSNLGFYLTIVYFGSFLLLIVALKQIFRENKERGSQSNLLSELQIEAISKYSF